MGGVLSARRGEVAPTARGSGGSRGIIPHARQQHQRQEGAIGRLYIFECSWCSVGGSTLRFMPARLVLWPTQAAALD